MKRLIAVLLAIISLISVLSFGVNATTESEIIQLEDGRYIEIITQTSPARISNNVSGSKVYTCYGSDDSKLWKATLTASYVFTGGSYTCTSADCTVTIYDSHWYVFSKTTNYAGNRATANLTMGRKYLGVTVEKPQYTLNLYCDFNGNLS